MLLNIDGQSFDALCVTGLDPWIETERVYDPMNDTWSDVGREVGTIVYLNDGRAPHVRAPSAQVFAMVNAAKRGLDEPSQTSAWLDFGLQLAAGFLQAAGWEVVPPEGGEYGEVGEDEGGDGDPGVGPA
jgi:hypothetical protein